MTDTDEDEITNAERARRCQTALKDYNDEWDIDSNLIDFLTDARHWSDLEGKDYAQFDRIAYQHYLVECTAKRRRPR